MSMGVYNKSTGLIKAAGSAVGTNPFSVGHNGLVPAPTADDANNVLHGDGTWKPAGKMLTQNLPAGQTTVTFTDEMILRNDAFISIFTSKYDASIESVEQRNDSIVITFSAMDVAIDVGIKIEV